MVQRLVVIAVALSSAVAGLVSGQAGEQPVASVSAAAVDAGCDSVPALARGRSPRLAEAKGMWAVAGRRLVSISAGASVQPSRVPADSIVKHVAVSEGAGTAYVVDRVGDDDVVVVTPEGTRRVRERAEVTHPAWSPRGDLAWATGTSIAVLDAETRAIERLPAPMKGATVFSPVFLSANRVAAVVSAPPTAEVPHGERLGNLWVSHPGAHRWRQLTSFASETDRWVTVRTPIVHRGTVHFVKVIGRGSATRAPRFELWKLDHGVARRVARLPGERYLAGSRGSRLVWNVPDEAHARQLVAVEGRNGLRVIGCGSVMVDPPDVVDPDRRAGSGHRVPPRGDWPELAAPSHAEAEEIAVIVGDFATQGEAVTVAEAIRAAYAGSRVDVVDSSIAPSAIKPGVYGALLHLPVDADPTAALATFHRVLPEYVSNSWIVTP